MPKTKLKIILTKGLPASGKTTWAKEFVKNNPDFVNVCKDDIRNMLGPNIKENQVLEIRDSTIKMYLSRNKSVVVSDTNLNPIHIATAQALADEFRAELEVNDSFLSVSMFECIKRDSTRPNKVGAGVIRQMYTQYLKPKTEILPLNPDLRNCYIFDIDGTLAVMGDRSPYDWKRVGIDQPHQFVVDIYKVLLQSKKDNPDQRIEIFIFSGRDSSCRSETLEWLEKHGVTDFKALYMRQTDDIRADTVIKKELYQTHIQLEYNVLGIFDDRDSVVQMWRLDLGLPCFQVNYGDF